MLCQEPVKEQSQQDTGFCSWLYMITWLCKRRKSANLSVNCLSRSSSVRGLFAVNGRTSKRPWTEVSQYSLHREPHTSKSTIPFACPNRRVRKRVQYSTKYSVNKTKYIVRDSSLESPSSVPLIIGSEIWTYRPSLTFIVNEISSNKVAAPEVAAGLNMIVQVVQLMQLTLILLTWRIGWAHNNARK